jgi:hypothetical protein
MISDLFAQQFYQNLLCSMKKRSESLCYDPGQLAIDTFEAAWIPQIYPEKQLSV